LGEAIKKILLTLSVILLIHQNTQSQVLPNRTSETTNGNDIPDKLNKEKLSYPIVEQQRNSEKSNVIKQLSSNQFYFLENKGQWDDKVLFMAQSKSLRTWITKNSIVFEQFEKLSDDYFKYPDKQDIKPRKGHAVGLEFVNPSTVNTKKGEAGSTKFNFIIGNDKSKHKSGVLQYYDVSIENIYEGIDMRYYFDNGELRYDFTVKPGANPDLIEMEIKGSDNFYIKDGDVVMETSLEPVIQKGLNAYQDKKQKKKVECKFKLKGNKLKFEIGNYDKSKELVIDPLTLVDSATIPIQSNTLIDITEIEIDLNNNLYFLGLTQDDDFPATFGKYDSTYNGGDFDIVIGKFDSNLNLLWTTFFGSSLTDRGRAIEIDSFKIYFAGWTNGCNFPIKNALDSINGTTDGFFSVISINGDSLLYSTYFGTDSLDMFNDMKKSLSGQFIFLVGLTYDPQNFPMKDSITTQTYNYNDCQGVIVGLTPSMDTLYYNLFCSSLFGGNKNSRVSNIYLEESAVDYPWIYISGETQSDSLSFNITPNAYKHDNNNNDTLVTISEIKYNEILGGLIIHYNTFYPSCLINFHDYQVLPILYRDSIFYFAGQTLNQNLPMVNAFDTSFIPDYTKGFLAIIDKRKTGENSLIYSSYFGNGTLTGSGIKDLDFINECNKVVFIGYTSGVLPIQKNINTQFIGPQDQMIGIVDITLDTNKTLTDLAYLNVNYSETYGNTVKHLNGSNRFIYTAGGSGWGPNSMTVFKLATQICPCPCEQTWLKITQNTSTECDSLNKCHIVCYVQIPSYYSDCYSQFQFEFGDSTLTDSIPQNGRINIYDGCIGEGERFHVTVKLFGVNGDTCIISDTSDICEAPCPCDSMEKFIDIRVEKGGSGCYPTQCKVSYRWNEVELENNFDDYCFGFISVNQDQIKNFNKYYPPHIDTCFESNDIFSTSISFYRSMTDPEPCTITKILDCSCCNDPGFLFNVLGPDTNCCYTFSLFQDMGISTCDSITHFKATKDGDSIPGRMAVINNPNPGFFDLFNYKICNETDSTINYYFEFFSDNTYSDSSKVCTRLVSLDPCIDIAAVCCEQIKLEIFLEKGGGGCADSLCQVTENWTIPDQKYDCFHHYVNSDGDTLPFDPMQPPDLISEDCLPPGTIIDDTVALLRFPGDPNPCLVHYQAYCPIADIRQGCNPDACDSIWTNDSLLFQEINSGSCQGCELTIFYKHRDKCGGWQDLQIKDIELKCPDTVQCTSTADEIYQLAVKMVISQNDMDFEPKYDNNPLTDSCSIQWRISQVSCWADWYWDPTWQKIEKEKNPKTLSDPVFGYGYTIYEPCDTTICCARQLKVCRYSQFGVEITDLGMLTEGGDCDTVFAYPPRIALPCYNVCDYLENFNELYPRINESQGETHQDTIITLQNNLVIVTYNQLMFKIMIEQNEASNVEINIFNLLGYPFISKSGNLKSGMNIYELDISNLISGIYVYNVSLDGISVRKGKMYIIR
jgi:hypothetical protein